MAAVKSTAKKAAGQSAKKTAGKKTPAKKAVAKKNAASSKYSDPALRDRIKDEVTAGEKGGRAGQWSARKAQLVAHEYEAQGGGYTAPRDETQQSLSNWSDEHWTTRDGEQARQPDGMHRYLPKEAWDKLTPAQQQQTDREKLAGDHQGKQFVANPEPALKAEKKARKSAAR